ncbi:ABC-type proline/glycine betaine transport system, permease component [Opitutaceae bacterium TAV1]|nr:ABC-type proline/glycine betaine transport system, permease component [Opitutaceae bacterium TAV1]
MTPLQIGKFFEQFVTFLKAAFQGFFETVSSTLGFVITALKNTLMIDPRHLYASVLFGLVVAVVMAALARRCAGRRAGRKLLMSAFVLTALAFGGLESWRLASINRPMTPDIAAQMQEDYRALAQLLEAEPVDAPVALLRSAADALAAAPAASQDPAVTQAAKATTDALRRIENARRGDTERIYESLRSAVDALAGPAVAESGLLPADTLADLEAQALRLQALTAITPAKRLIRDLERLTEPKPMNRFINQRSYERLAEVLRASHACYTQADNAALRDASARALGQLRKLNPARLDWYAPALLTFVMVAIAWLVAGRGVAVFSLVGLILIFGMQLWEPTIESLALVLAATLFALLLGIPLGIAAARSRHVDQALRPFLDLMQTMPAFVYLIPAVIFFGLGEVPGAMATLIFSMPPAVRLTALGIRQVPQEIVEAAQAFGSTGSQMLFKAQLPIAMPTILAGVNQTIMLSLSMVVIAGMIGAGGLGSVVLGGITQMKLGLGFEGGLAVVILAIYLDRVTQAMGKKH